MSASGHWSRTAFGGGLSQLALVPGTTSVLAAGAVNTKSGTSARVWAHGTFG